MSSELLNLSDFLVNCILAFFAVVFVLGVVAFSVAFWQVIKEWAE